MPYSLNDIPCPRFPNVLFHGMFSEIKIEEISRPIQRFDKNQMIPKYARVKNLPNSLASNLQIFSKSDAYATSKTIFGAYLRLPDEVRRERLDPGAEMRAEEAGEVISTQLEWRRIKDGRHVEAFLLSARIGKAAMSFTYNVLPRSPGTEGRENWSEDRSGQSQKEEAVLSVWTDVKVLGFGARRWILKMIRCLKKLPRYVEIRVGLTAEFAACYISVTWQCGFL